MNKNLEAYYDAWDKFIKTWIVIKIKDPSCVYEWRLQVSKTALTRMHSSLLYVLFLIICLKNLQAEIAMRAEGKPGMSDEEVRIPYPFYSRTSFSCYPTIFHFPFSIVIRTVNTQMGYLCCRYKTLFHVIYQHTMLTFPHSTLKVQTGRTRTDSSSSKSTRRGILFSYVGNEESA